MAEHDVTRSEQAGSATEERLIPVALEPGFDYLVYGAGSSGVRVAAAIRRVGARVVAFADRDPAKQGRLVDGVPVLPPADLPRLRASGARIVLATEFVASARQTLEALGLRANIDFSVPFTGAPAPSAGVLTPADRAKIAALKDRHAGSVAFLLGNGPSVQTPDLERICSRVTFSCNRFHLAYDKMSFRPRYTVSSDPQMIADFGAEMVTKSAGTVILASEKRPSIEGEYVWVRLKVERPMRFSEDPMDNIAPGGATLVAALQMGYYMGIRRFFLYGVDHSFSYEKVAGAELARSAKGDGNHFIQDYRSGRAWYPPAMQQIEESFQICDQFLRERGGWLRNASRRTQLPNIERVSFEDALATVES